jgi:bifunctional non-homologous end joining protein LigD
LPAARCAPAAGGAWLDSRDQARRVPDLAHRQGRSVKLLSRNGNDLAHRFPTAVAAIAALSVSSCVIDGEAIVCDDNGLAVFDLARGHGRNARALLCAFDLLELDGEDLRRAPIEAHDNALESVI